MDIGGCTCQRCGRTAFVGIITLHDERQSNRSFAEPRTTHLCQGCFPEVAEDPRLIGGDAYAYAPLDHEGLPIAELTWSKHLPQGVKYKPARVVWSWSIQVDWADERSVAVKAVHPHYQVAKYEVAGSEWVADLTRPTRMLIGTVGQARLSRIADQMRWEYVVHQKVS